MPPLSSPLQPHRKETCAQTLRRGWAAVGAISQVLLGPRYRRTTLLLWFIWVTNAMTYYGNVILAAQLAVQETASCGDNNMPFNSTKKARVVSSCVGGRGAFCPQW